MYKYSWTKDENRLKEWDVFLNSTPRGHYTQLSGWLKTFKAYGFDYNVLLATQNGSIIGGVGVVIPKFYIFKFLIVPCGPIVLLEHEEIIENLLSETIKHAKKLNCCYAQILLPLLKSNNPSDFTISKINKSSIFYTGVSGSQFKFITVPKGLKIINFKELNYNIENIKKYISSDARRNIKISEKSNIYFRELTTLEDISEAYNLFILNAKSKNYSIRDKKTFLPYIKPMIDKGTCVFFGAIHQDKIIGASLFLIAGKRITYIMGGNIGHEYNVRVGHNIHWQAFKYFIKDKPYAYDFTPGGPATVKKFKSSFNSVDLNFFEPNHWVLNKSLFYIFKNLYPFLKKHKKLISKILK